MGVKYAFPANQRISPECLDLVARIFNADPTGRITMADIRRHPWFLKNLPAELSVRALQCPSGFGEALRQGAAGPQSPISVPLSQVGSSST